MLRCYTYILSGLVALGVGWNVDAAPVTDRYSCTLLTPSFSTGSPMSATGNIVCPMFDSSLGTLTGEMPASVWLSFGVPGGTVELRNSTDSSFSGDICGHVPCVTVFYAQATLGALPGHTSTRIATQVVLASGMQSLLPGELRSYPVSSGFFSGPVLNAADNPGALVSEAGPATFDIPVSIVLKAEPLPDGIDVTSYSIQVGIDMADVFYTYEPVPEPASFLMTGLALLAGGAAIRWFRRDEC